MKDFAAELQKHHIKHWWTYPESPGMNACCERFNRTLQEPSVDYYENLLFDDVHAFKPGIGTMAGVLQHRTPSPSLEATISDTITHHSTHLVHFLYIKLIHYILIPIQACPAELLEDDKR